MAYLEGYDRKQVTLFQQCIDELIPEVAKVRIIDTLIDGMNLADLGFSSGRSSLEGRPAYAPADLLKLYVYGYLNRVRTSRLLERERKRNVELMWLMKGFTPCFRTIAGFRSENPEAFRNLFTGFVKRLKSEGFIDGRVLAVDGTKFRAVNSKKNNYNKKKVDRHLEYIDQKITEYIAELDEEDLKEDKQEELHQKIRQQKGRRRKYKKIEKMLEESGATQISTTDPESRSMIIHGQVVEVAYNVQTVVENQNKLVVEYEATNENDRKALAAMAARGVKACDRRTAIVLADKGYHNGEQIATCQGNKITTIVASQEVPRSGPVPTPDYYGTKFKYHPRKDSYTCPEGNELVTNHHWYNKKYEDQVTRVKHYKTAKCETCPARSLCTTNPAGRVIERSEYADAVEKNARNLSKQKELYRERQQLIEHVFGTIKRQWGFDHILLQGIRKNNGEMGLILALSAVEGYFVYNLRRFLNLTSRNSQKMNRKGVFFLFLRMRGAICGNGMNSILKIYIHMRRAITRYGAENLSFCTNCRYLQPY